MLYQSTLQLRLYKMQRCLCRTDVDVCTTFYVLKLSGSDIVYPDVATMSLQCWCWYIRVKSFVHTHAIQYENMEHGKNKKKYTPLLSFLMILKSAVKSGLKTADLE